MSAFETVGRPVPESLRAIARPQRLQIEYLLQPDAASTLELNSGHDIIQGLSQTPKTLPPKYFYDDRGSQLFEQICELPEYYLTRTETQILKECASAIATLTGPCELVELGSGSSLKTRLLIEAYETAAYPLRYVPIDVSAGILEASAHSLLADYPSLEIHGLVATYELALARLQPSSLARRMICFLGSTLGNLSQSECHHFFEQVKAALKPGEFFLLGVDLHKDVEVLNAAYNDAQGVTADFNLNMLQHLNWRFQGNFNLDQFEHWAFYNPDNHQIEMHLKSLVAQSVTLQALNFIVEFAAGETIHSEISRKFDLPSLQQELTGLGLIPRQIWQDPQNWFAVMLCQV